MSNLLGPDGQPVKGGEKITLQQIMQALIALQIKNDGLATQMMNLSITLEYIIDKLNTFAEQEDMPSLAMNVDEFEEYFKARMGELQEELTNAMKQQAGMTQANINLDE